MHQMLLEQTSEVFGAGLSAPSIIASDRRLHVVVDRRDGRQVVLRRNSDNQIRLFSDPETAIKVLHDIGIRTSTVNTNNLNAGQAKLSSQ